MSEVQTSTDEELDQIDQALDAYFERGEQFEVVDDAKTPSPPTETVPTPAVQGEAPEAGQEGAQTPETPATPTWFDSLSAEDRLALVQSELAKLSPEDRANLSPVKEVLDRTSQSAEARTRNRIEEANSEAQRQSQLLQSAKTLAERFADGLVQDTGAELDNYASQVARLHEERLGDRLSESLIKTMSRFGLEVKDVPASVAQDAEAARARQGVVGAYSVYLDFLADRVGSLSTEKGMTTGQAAAKAKDAADVARIRAEYLAELTEQGHYIPNVPPLISGQAAMSSPADISEEEFTAAINDPIAQERLENDPVKGPQFKALMLQAMTG